MNRRFLSLCGLIAPVFFVFITVLDIPTHEHGHNSKEGFPLSPSIILPKRI
jgi:hypothetical protein